MPRKRKRDKKRETFLAQQRALGRRRQIVFALGFVPIVGGFACQTGVAAFFCVVPLNWWLLIWAALFGTYLGLTIRLIRERRRFERGTAGVRAQ